MYNCHFWQYNFKYFHNLVCFLPELRDISDVWTHIDLHQVYVHFGIQDEIKTDQFKKSSFMRIFIDGIQIIFFFWTVDITNDIMNCIPHLRWCFCSHHWSNMVVESFFEWVTEFRIHFCKCWDFPSWRIVTMNNIFIMISYIFKELEKYVNCFYSKWLIIMHKYSYT